MNKVYFTISAIFCLFCSVWIWEGFSIIKRINTVGWWIIWFVVIWVTFTLAIYFMARAYKEEKQND